ncbi:MAG: Swt1 family HEPN domain-containing protein [Actinomycetota bacterium]|nr:Swt1 family HEPN domain-containing protein [Actinomycetota bacterium]
MAISNRDRVGRGFELLADGLEPFVDPLMAAAAGSGADWLALLAARENARHGTTKTFDRRDPAVLLRVLTEEWRVFKDRLSRPEQAMCSELRDVRNRWAHNAAFNSDDTYRALDSMERLLTAVDAPEQADEVRRLRLDHQRAAYEAETRKVVKAATIASVPGAGLKPWRDVVTPHKDVASGDFNAAEFAADLHKVALGESGEEYIDPVLFFQRTYLTEGLRDLIGRAARRLSGDLNASPVVNLQTNFGGGKTHSMLALYHLASGTPVTAYPQEVQEAIGAADPCALGAVKRVALVGTHLSAGSATIKPDGTQVNTLWGELAWQLDGCGAYDVVAEADRTKTNPGQALADLLSAHAPCLVLIDEWVAYARQLFGRDAKDVAGGDFDTQFTFAQTLTEVAKTIPGCLVVISIPASSESSDAVASSTDLEVGGANGRLALERLQNVVRRVADQWRPASATESFEIVRRRLFVEPDADAKRDVAAVARQFVQFYAEHRGQFPRQCSEVAYEDRIRAAYPVHPELFDRLYEDWSTLERFQRTRGVLRLMSAVIHALWASGDAGPLIMPGSVPLELPGVAGELTQYLQDAWKPIVDTDIDGEGSTPVRIDAERETFGKRALTRRIARTIFLGSAATLQTASKGIERQNVWLGVGIPGDTVGNFGSALEVLGQRATYLNVDGARYWYDTAVTVNRTAQDFAERLREHPEEVWAEVVRRLSVERSARGDFATLQVCPEDTGAVPDTEEAKLVVLHPQHLHGRGQDESAALRFAQQCLDTRGSSQRTNRNALVFLAPDRQRWEELAAATADYLAWRDVAERADDLNLTAQQKAQAARRRDQADDTVRLRILATYIWAVVPEQPDPARPVALTVQKAEGAQERLADRVTAKLRQGGLLATTYGMRNVRMDLDGPLRAAWAAGHISAGELWGYYCRYPYLSRLRDRTVLEQALRSALDEMMWELDGFALADGYDEATQTYRGLATYPKGSIGTITDSVLVVEPRKAAAQMAAAKPAGGTTTDTTTTTTSSTATTAATSATGSPATAPAATRFFGAVELDPERYARDFNKVAAEVLQHLSADPSTRLEVRVEITATNPQGFDSGRVRTVSENATTLKFSSHGFEKE